jgi:hypothetical protein
MTINVKIMCAVWQGLETKLKVDVRFEGIVPNDECLHGQSPRQVVVGRNSILGRAMAAHRVAKSDLDAFMDHIEVFLPRIQPECCNFFFNLRLASERSSSVFNGCERVPEEGGQLLVFAVHRFSRS